MVPLQVEFASNARVNGLPARTLVGATVGGRQIAPGETVNKNRPKVPARSVTDKLPATIVWK